MWKNGEALTDADFCVTVYDYLLDTKIKTPNAGLPSRFVLAKRLRISPSRAGRALRHLEKRGVLVIERYAGVELWALQGGLFSDGWLL